MTASTLPLRFFESSTLARLEKPRVDAKGTLPRQGRQPLSLGLCALMRLAGYPEFRFFVLKYLIHGKPRHTRLPIANV